MITASINILIYSLLMLFIGLYKPKWALFWMKKPDRIAVVVFSGILFMVAATLFGEGSRTKQNEATTSVSKTEEPGVQQ